ncbi:MAG TPA: DMT family transporter [Vicinamibacterales bacterium]|nr:DMT family transporter [Vicinamibacterales bacterium]
MTYLIALSGVLAISFSAVFIRLAAVSPVTGAFFRAAYAVPMLALVWLALRKGDRRDRGARLLAFASGIVLAMDLALWHESIALIGVGLATVIANVQVVFVALAAWLLFDERPSRATVVIIVTVLAGITLTSGLSRAGAYGENPELGVMFGAGAGACYSVFLLTFRQATRVRAPTAGPLLDSTIGTMFGALLVSPLDRGFSLVPAWPAHGWLAALALVSQVLGWLAIATALPLLPAVETSILLLMQPVFSVIWGFAWFGERLSPLQWGGTALVLGGVVAIGRTRATT